MSDGNPLNGCSIVLLLRFMFVFEGTLEDDAFAE